MNTTIHHQHMSLALHLAAQGRATVSPNPMVGCVIVKNDRIIGQGFHQKAGEWHAERIALDKAGEEARGAIVYVTLEPCYHHGRTPPCTDALIAAGIKKVYVACVDPNPLVSSKGIAALRAANIEVEVGLCELEAKALNEIFIHYITNRRPFVIAKWAMSLDGKTAVHSSDTKQISGQQSQKHCHILRNQVDAILVGANTAIQDNPQLTVRFNETSNVRQPIRIILAGNKPLPSHLILFNDQHPNKTFIATTANNKHLFASLINEKIELMVLPHDNQGRARLSALLEELAKKNITSLLVEGGMTVLESFMKENLINQFHVYLAPFLIGASQKKYHLPNLNFNQLGDDYYFTANIQETKNV